MKVVVNFIFSKVLVAFILMLTLVIGFLPNSNELGQVQIEYAFQDLVELEDTFQEIDEHSEEDKEYLPFYFMVHDYEILSGNLQVIENLLPLGFICDFAKPPRQK